MMKDRRILVGRELIALIALMGIWEIISPFVLNYSGYEAEMRTAVITGIFILLFAALGTMINNPGVGIWSDAQNFILGIWLIITPFVFGFTYMNLTAMINNWVTGGIITVATVVSYIVLSQAERRTA